MRQFLRHGEISVFDRWRDIIHTKGPGGVFIFENFVAHEPEQAEQRWQPVETQMHRVFQLLGRRAALNEPWAVDALRDLLALHWARSPATRAAHERVRDQVVYDHRRAWAAQPAFLARIYRDRTGLHPAGLGELEWINDELHDIPADVTERFFSERNAAHFQYARDRFARSALQIGYAPAGHEFLIGDAPVITVAAGRSGFGPHQGIALGDAVQVVMPVSPTIMIGLGPEPLEVVLPERLVDHYNRMQHQSFVRWLGCRPGGPVDLQLRREMQARTVLPLLSASSARRHH